MLKNNLEKWAWGLLKKASGKKEKNYKLGYETEVLKYISNYKPDFILVFPSGRKVYIETKGYFSQADRSKISKVLKSNPTIDLRFVFSKDNTLYRRSKSRYSDWCRKHNIPCAIGAIPKEWLVDKNPSNNT